LKDKDSPLEKEERQLLLESSPSSSMIQRPTSRKKKRGLPRPKLRTELLDSICFEISYVSKFTRKT